MANLFQVNGSMASDCDLNATIALNSRWIYEYFGDCVVVKRQYFAFGVGLLSILSWICAQLPQIVVNCKTGEADKALSFWFLFLWMCSDSANFVGAILTNQLVTQIILAAYFVFIDLVSIVQFYVHYSRNQGVKKSCFKLKSTYGSTQVAVVALVFLLPSVLFLFGTPHKSLGGQWYKSTWKGRTLLEADEIIDGSDSLFIVGYVLGCISAVVYLFALPPQIIKNFSRCSVKGLSVMMFIFVSLGDFNYVLSVLLFSVDKVFIIRTLPWLLGSGGPLFFDIFLVVQILVYNYLDHSKKRSSTTDH